MATIEKPHCLSCRDPITPEMAEKCEGRCYECHREITTGRIPKNSTSIPTDYQTPRQKHGRGKTR